MSMIEEILKEKIRPKEKQARLVEAITSKKISADELIGFFKSASDTDKGSCADVMKNVSARNPEIFLPYIGFLVTYINYKAPRVKWGIPETIGNMAKKYPDETEKAIPFLLENITDKEINTTVIKWCSAFALAEIVKYNPSTQNQLVPVFEKRITEEKNNGVKNLYLKALKEVKKV